MNALTDTRITRDVILDLLPAVRGGVASADSRRLVEDYLAHDPEFAARAAVLVEKLQPVGTDESGCTGLRKTP